MGITIPDWKPLDFSGATKIPLLFQAAQKAAADEELARQNAATQKAYADNETLKISNEAARHSWEDARTAQKDAEGDAQDAASQFAPGSLLSQAVGANSPMAPMIAKAHHINLTPPVTTTAPMPDAKPAEPDQNAEAAQFLSRGAQHKSGADVLDEIQPGLSTQDPTAGPQYGPADPNAGSPPVTPDINVDAELGKRPAPTTTTPWMAEVAGQRFEVKPRPPAAPFGDPEYDAMYSRLIAQGDDPQKAEAKVLTLRGQNIGAAGKSTSQAETHRHNVAGEGLGGERIGQSDINSKRAADARITSAGILANGPASMSKEQGIAMNALNQRMTQIRGVAAWQKLIEAENTSNVLEHDIETGAVPLQGNEAKVLAARLIRGRVSNEEMHQLFDNIGGTQDAFQRFAHNTIGGEMTPEQWRQLRISTKVLIDQHQMMKERAGKVIAVGLGPRTFAQMPDQAQQAADLMYAELGLDPQDLFGGATGGIQPGAHHRGKVTPGPSSPSAPTSPPPAQGAPAPLTDEQAVQMAQQRYAKNPGDAIAAAVLRAHGLLK